MVQRVHHITPQEALQRTIEHREIFHDEMLHLMRLIMGGEMSPVMMAALITLTKPPVSPEPFRLGRFSSRVVLGTFTSSYLH